MSRVTRFEQELIDAALIQPGLDLAPGTAVVLLPDSVEFLQIFDTAVSPALVDCGFRAAAGGVTFNSHSWVSDAARWILSAEIIVADVTNLNADVMYVVGLCHGLGRCPLLVSQNREALPFNLEFFRCLRYANDKNGLRILRSRLRRSIRVFAAGAAASRKKWPG